MKSLKNLLLLAVLLALAVSLYASQNEFGEENLSFDEEEALVELENDDIPYSEYQETDSLGGTRRFLAKKSNTRGIMKCNKYPRVCHAKGSPGHDCCKKKCVNVKTDRLNCGMCGRKCKYSEVCCNGKCVNPRSDKKHCGSCNNKCKKGFSCSYGMCSYA